MVFPASTHSFFIVGLLQAMGVHAEPSLIRTLPGACGLSSFRDEVQTLPGGWAQVGGHNPGHWVHSRPLATLPQVVPVVSAPSEMRGGHSCWMGTLPGRWAHFRLLSTLPRMVPVVSAPSEMRCSQSPDG